MRIAVNTRLMQLGKLDGIGWFTYQSLKHLIQLHPQHKFDLLFDRKPEIEPVFDRQVNIHVIGPKARHPLAYLFWMEFRVCNWLNRHKPDLFFSPDGMLSLRYKGKQVPVIHDLNFEHRPRDLRWYDLRYYQTFFPCFAQKAHRIITVSEFSKQDLIHTYTISKSKIYIAYNGINEGYKPVTPDIKHATQKHYSASQAYFIYVGSLHPRKNILGLLKGYSLYLKSGGTSKLLLCGARFWNTNELDTCITDLNLKTQVIFTGIQNLEVMNILVASAEALCLVSYYEGFGIPIIEAMASGVPVICSQCTAMPEVSGDAALWIDPTDPNTIGTALTKIELSKVLKDELVTKGLIRATLFSWSLTAQKLTEALEL